MDIVNFKKDFSKLSIALFGVSYRSNVGDTRYSPVESFYKYLLEDGINIKIHDPYVRYWDEMNLEIHKDIAEVINTEFDILIFSTAHDEYKKSEIIQNFFEKSSPKYIFDMVGVLSDTEISFFENNNHKVFVLGRGDLN